MNLAKIYLDCGDIQSALTTLKEVNSLQAKINLNGLQSAIEALLARCEIELGKFHIAQKRLSALMKFENLDIEDRSIALWLLGEIVLHKKNIKHEIKILEEINYTASIHALTLSVRLRADILRSQVDIKNTTEGMILLETKQVPVPEALRLRWALFDSFIFLDQAKLSKQMYNEAQLLTNKLANSLSGQVQNIFLIQQKESNKIRLQLA